MASTPKKRPKPGYTNPKTKPDDNNPSSSCSSSHSLLMEPSPDFFPSKGEFLRLVTVVAIAASVAMACNYVVTFLNRQPKPFCDSNIDFDNSLSDFCEPCPSNGECYEGKLECARGYRKHGKLCVEDGDINETAKKLLKLVEIRVCEAYAQYLCDGTGTVWAQEDELWNNFDEFKLMKNYGLDDTIYMHAKQRTMVTVDKLLETRTNTHGIKELKCPDLIAEHYKPVTCYIRQWIAKHTLVLIPVCASLVGCTLLLLRFRRRHYLSVRAEQLYNKVCDILEENAFISKSGNGEEEPWVVASWLRDHLLLPRERKDPLLWKKVEELVQEDSRLDRYPKLVKGESKVVWEWQVEGSLSSSRKRKKVEESKLKSSVGMKLSSSEQRWALKATELLNC
uniref:Man1/Src1-like C-terminal domain-containing protein n=1 Tax=Davidia involucrata TaxID=16924 RepID=A0A5B7BXT4_DAVIN